MQNGAIGKFWSSLKLFSNVGKTTRQGNWMINVTPTKGKSYILQALPTPASATRANTKITHLYPTLPYPSTLLLDPLSIYSKTHISQPKINILTYIFSRDQRLITCPCRSVGRSVCRSVIILQNFTRLALLEVSLGRLTWNFQEMLLRGQSKVVDL